VYTNTKALYEAMSHYIIQNRKWLKKTSMQEMTEISIDQQRAWWVWKYKNKRER